MTRSNIAALVAGLLALVGLALGAYGLYRSANAQNQMTTLQATLAADAETNQVVLDRLGIATLQPAQATDAANVARDPADVPPPITRTAPTTVQVTLTAREVTAELADGTTYAFWTFDGTVPGPMVRVMEGDTVEFTLVNDLSSVNGHNIDFHAVNGPGGGAEVTNVAPGETATFTWKALHAGAFVYHCAFPPPMHHIAQGMYGAIVVEPVGGLPPVDREFYIMQGDWYTAGRLGNQGHQTFSNEKALAELPEYYTFNGHVQALTELYPLQAEVGETVRVFFGVGGPNKGSNFHIIGEVFDRVYSGSDETFTANEEAWYVPPGSVSTFEMFLDVPGSYTIVDHALYRVQKGAVGVLQVSGDPDPTVFDAPELDNE
ncbi:MAG: nitrite reductase, copper-containing [Candidatus Promineofilum sp.]|nr:nitrite reductase, copper-containing [Promineifilum sp.]